MALVVGALHGSDDAAPAPRAARTATVTDTTPAAPPEPERARGARELFVSECAVCHKLRAAGATGLVGPDLDALQPSAGRVAQQIASGSADGVMPAMLVRGAEARRLARYVAHAAGRR